MNLRPTLIKLTLWYTLLIMLVSGLLSFVVYEGAGRPLERRLELRQPVTGEFMGPARGEFRPHQFDPEAVSEVKRNVALFIVYFNLAVLGLAGIASYSLARRELKPVETAMDLQSRFTSDAAHELRTPLTAMKSEIEVALRAGALEEGEARELLESNLEEIGKLEALSSSLLKLAQYEEGSGISMAGAIPVGELLREAADSVRHPAAEKRIGIQVSAQDARVKGDRASLLEMLVVLLDNSIRYSPADTTVTLAGRVEKRQAVITVADQGYGIEKEDLEHIFDRFYRGRLPATAQVGGYGLGLSIARRIARLHHGEILIESAPGRGTTVTVRLPLALEKRRAGPGPGGGPAGGEELGAEPAPGPEGEPRKQPSA